MEASRAADVDAALPKLAALQESLSAQEQSTLTEVSDLLVLLGSEHAALREQVRWLAGKPYRSQNESVAPGQLALEILTLLKGEKETADIGPLEDVARSVERSPREEIAASAPTPRKKKKRRPLRVVEEETKLAEDELACESCGTTRHSIGCDTIKTLVHVPKSIFLQVERLHKYACKGCEDGIVRSESQKPPKPIPGSLASSSLLADLAIGKVLDGIPVERMAKIYARHGADLPTSTLNDWFGKTAEILEPIHKRIHASLLESELISLDDTSLKAQNRSHAKNMQAGRQWLYIGDRSRVVYAEYTPDWKGSHPRGLLEGFTGAIQNDGYAGINSLFVGPKAPVRVGCNDHARRKFVEALRKGDTRAGAIVDLYNALYAIEREAKDEKLGTDETRGLRQEKGTVVWKRLDEEIEKVATATGKKSPLGKAITYYRRQSATLRAYLDDGFLPISNAHVERQIKTVALMRKNSLFVGSIEAGKRFSVLLTLLLNCRLCGANPYHYLVDVLSKIADDWPNVRIDELLPRRWLELRDTEEQTAGEAQATA